jgi:DNA recombination protein RmuC
MQFDPFMLASAVSLLLFLLTLFLYFKQKDINKRLLQELENLEEIQEYKNNLEVKYAVLQTRYEEEVRGSQEKLEVLQKAKDELSKEFQLLANKIFEDKAKQFSSSSKEQLELLLKPFREQITSFSLQAREQFNAHSKETHLLKDELMRLKQMNDKLSEDAINLTKALKGENKTQGNWGEIVLENILEQSGLRQGEQYELQATLKSQEGKTYRPDVIIHLPRERDIIVDSKVSLVAYERFINATDEELKKKALKEHIASISSHIKELSAKKYEKLEGVKSLDFVLLFMPIEGAFLLALEKDGNFFKQAYEQNILVVSPSTLLVTLRTIEHIWRTQHQEEHAKRIADEGEAMLHKLALFVDEMKKIGTQIDNTKKSYDVAMGRLKTGNGNIIKRAENMQELGVKLRKQIALESEESEL